MPCAAAKPAFADLRRCALTPGTLERSGDTVDPPTLLVLETAFDEAWLTLKSIGNTTVKPDELARSVLRLAMEGERDPNRLHDGALEGLLPAAIWREAN